jgi:hypothetical protein
MATSPAQAVLRAYCETHDKIFAFADTLTHEQLHWRPTSHSHSIGFHVWHVVRWADYMQAAFPGMTPTLQQRLGVRPQLWVTDSLAVEWGFGAFPLGYAETGMDMPDALVTELPFPEKPTFLAYVQRAFQAVEQAVQAIDDLQYQEPELSQPLTEEIWGAGTVGDAVLEHLMHDSYHFGIMRSLHSLQTAPADGG